VIDVVRRILSRVHVIVEEDRDAGRRVKWLTVCRRRIPTASSWFSSRTTTRLKLFKKGTVADGIPYIWFAVDDVQAEFDRLSVLGVKFVQGDCRKTGLRSP
jgi:hypothetical protein